jgi:hypothetical protein
VLGEVLAEDPAREEAHVGLMRLHAPAGARGSLARPCASTSVWRRFSLGSSARSPVLKAAPCARR